MNKTTENGLKCLYLHSCGPGLALLPGIEREQTASLNNPIEARGGTQYRTLSHRGRVGGRQRNPPAEGGLRDGGFRLRCGLLPAGVERLRVGWGHPGTQTRGHRERSKSIWWRGAPTNVYPLHREVAPAACGGLAMRQEGHKWRVDANRQSEDASIECPQQRCVLDCTHHAWVERTEQTTRQAPNSAGCVRHHWSHRLRGGRGRSRFPSARLQPR